MVNFLTKNNRLNYVSTLGRVFDKKRLKPVKMSFVRAAGYANEQNLHHFHSLKKHLNNLFVKSVLTRVTILSAPCETKEVRFLASFRFLFFSSD